jgi:hypothetical protein
MSRGLTVGSLRAVPQARVEPRRVVPSQAAARAALGVLADRPATKARSRCCRTGCAGCPYGEAMRRAAAARQG